MAITGRYGDGLGSVFGQCRCLGTGNYICTHIHLYLDTWIHKGIRINVINYLFMNRLLGLDIKVVALVYGQI